MDRRNARYDRWDDDVAADWAARDPGRGRREARTESEDAPALAGGAEASSASRPGTIGTINGLPWGEYLVREYATPRRIALYDVGGGGSYAGLIAPAPSGYRLRQQTSGMMCAQRELEGLYLPLPDPTLASDLEALHVGCCSDTLDDREASDAYRAGHPEEVAQAEAAIRERWPELAAVHAALAAVDRPLGITAEEADQLDALLQEARLPLHVARERLQRSTEAWVWVRIAGNVATWEHEFAGGVAPADDHTGALGAPTGYRWQWMLAALADTEAVLTWENCD